ncbi:hypothetical protein SAE02_72910 [Skermanella aerolata]|uniref:Uncharacterized protein n=1 Tax=Skermanella aerolata TaxID=393310 RepID=A0A512E335_9PROT|nr:hypothetical protein [Skermanella aerolata]KJB90628.1 hypothetical protein N826_36985 [Skermanella aerolata KACC 11604]GEO43143.1 hypothetical protein SAE02_72910 [Skermanella aerolata]
MTALPAPSPDAIRLREFVAQLSNCSTIDERDELLGAIIGEVKEILIARPGFVRHWLLALDRINRRFIGANSALPCPVAPETFPSQLEA